MIDADVAYLSDAYRRYVVLWELLTSMMKSDVRLVMQEAIERTGASPQVVTDHGSPFTALEFKDLVRRFALQHIRIRTHHPASHGVVRRFYPSTREALSESALTKLGQLRALNGE